MTVSTTASQITIGLNGATNVFSFPFIGVSASDIIVIYTNASGTSTTLNSGSYSVSLNAPATGQIWGVGGTITYPLTGPNISSGSLTISRILPLTQSAEISNQGNQYSIVTEEALDILCMEIQQVAARTGQYRDTWVTATVYNFGDIVVDGANGNNTTNWYLCANANTSGTWSTDLANGDWILILNLQSIANPGTVAAGGDLSGNYPNPTISKIQGTPISGITGTGEIVFQTSPTLITPVLGVATATSLATGSMNVTGLTASELVATNGSKTLVSTSTLPNLTTATTQNANDNSTNVATTAYADRAAANAGLGVGQTWTDETASRSGGTTYTNSTGKPIAVSIVSNAGGNATLTLNIGSLPVSYLTFNSVGGAPAASLFGIVPNGVTYSVTVAAGSISHWYELR